MTYNTKNTTIVFAFAAMLMAAPLAIGNAYAVGGDGVIDAACSIELPTSIDLGTITPGADTGEVLVSIVTDGTVPGTFEIQMDDNWDGVGTQATASLLILSDAVTETFTVNGHVFLGVDSSSSAGEFDTSGSISAQATALASQINLSTQTVTENFGTSIEVTAFASGNAVLLTAETPGTGPDGTIAISSTDEAIIDTITAGDTGFLEGGVAAAQHLTAEQVHYEVVTDGGSAPSSTYASKDALGAETVNTVLTTASDPSENIDIYFHFNGVNDDATGTITIQAGLVSGDTIVVGGTTFTAESTLADVDGNEFFTTEGTVNDDAIALAAAINAVPNTPDVTASSSTDTVTVTAKRSGTGGNSITFTESGAGVVLLPATNVLAGGLDALANLPYAGVITSTMTFTADCGA